MAALSLGSPKAEEDVALEEVVTMAAASESPSESPSPSALLDRLRAAIKAKDGEAAAAVLSEGGGVHTTRLFGELSSVERLKLFDLLGTARGPEHFQALRPSEQGVVVGRVQDEELSRLFLPLPAATRLALIKTLPQGAVDRLLPLLTAEEAQEAQGTERSPLSVARFMVPVSGVAIVRRKWSAAQAIEHLRKCRTQGALLVDGRALVVSRNNHLKGRLDPIKLIGADPDVRVADLAEAVPLTYSIHDHVDDVLSRPQGGAESVPVLDEKTLFGVATTTLLMKRMKDRFRKVQQIGAMQAIDSSFAKASYWLLVRKRILWMILLMCINFGGSQIIGAFEHVLQSHVALAFFIPLIIAMGGNAGGQSTTLIANSLATKDVTLRDLPRVLLKESIIACIISAPLSIVMWGVAWAMYGIDIAWVLLLSMFAVLIFSDLSGILLPFAAVLLHQDPAVSSSPLLTSIVDVMGILIYFGFVEAFLDLGGGHSSSSIM